MAIWRIDANVVPTKGEVIELPTFYIECDSSEVEKRALEIIGKRPGVQCVKLGFGPLSTPRKSAANRYPTEGVWLGGLDCTDIFNVTEETNA